MSDIEIGSEWIEKKPKEIFIALNVALNPGDNLVYVQLDKMYKGWDLLSQGSFLRNFEPKADMVNEPPHYKDASGVECIEVTKYMQFCGGNCFKYLYRAGKKGSTIEDLKKAAWYADKAWEQMEVVSREAMDGIWTIAQHRSSGYIQTAMLYIREDMWADVKRQINHEIERLESEQ